MTVTAVNRRVWTRYVAIGDSFTEGMSDPDPTRPDAFVGWADYLAVALDEASEAGLLYANLAVRGRMLADVVGPQLDAALAMSPDLVSMVGGGNDLLRPSVDLDALAASLEAAVLRIRATGADVLLVDGGDATYLCHWMRESGLAELLPSLRDTVWVGVSAGSMVMTPRIGEYFVEWPAAPDDRGLGVVDFSIFPHLDAFPTNTLEHAERWAADVGVPAYAIDEQTAIKVVDGTVDVVSEGRWRKFEP